jgi:hypothetical protein
MPQIDEQAVENKSLMFLFDLQNLAKEHGFKGDDIWELAVLSDRERSLIQKNHHPSAATKISPALLLPVFKLVKSRLGQQLNEDEESLNAKAVLNRELTFLVAYNTKRVRT